MVWALNALRLTLPVAAVYSEQLLRVDTLVYVGARPLDLHYLCPLATYKHLSVGKRLDLVYLCLPNCNFLSASLGLAPLRAFLQVQLALLFYY